MRLVVQEDAFGCAVACVASILNISYQDTLKLFPRGKKRATLSGFYCRDLVKVVKKRNLKYHTRFLKKMKVRSYSIGTIVFIKKSNKYWSGHYLLKTKGGWMNPWINFPYEPRIAGINKRLPGKATYMIQPVLE